MRVGFISTFPKKGLTHVNSGGVPGYAKCLAMEMVQRIEVMVFCNKLKNYPSRYDDYGIQICRCWKKGFLYPLYILIYSLRYKIDIFHIQHEYFLFGGIISAMIFPLMLLLLRTKAPVVTTFHGIISKQNVDKLTESNKNKFLNYFIFVVLKFNLLQISLLSNSIIVHDNYIRDILIDEYNLKRSKVIVIPHGIEINKLIDQIKAKEILKINAKKVVLFFGYLTKRKGLETLIEAFEKIDCKLYNALLIIGAGENPRLKDNNEYKKYYQSIKKRIQLHPFIKFTGFIPEDKLRLYISASDVIVFPYSVSVAASGALHFALGYDKIILCSNISAFNELIRNEKLLFNVDDKEDLYNKLINILNLSEKEIFAINEQLYNIRKGYSWNVISLKTFSLYKTILKKSHE